MASITIAPEQAGVRSRFAALVESFRRKFVDGKPCWRHPGHRDAEEAVGDFGNEQFVCSACFDEGRHED